MADQFRTIVGVVQFPPKEGEAAGKPVRNIAIQQTGFREQSVRVYATVWPSHKHVPLEKGDVVVAEGKYTRNENTDDDGTKRVFHNLSVSRIAVLGKVDEGTKPATENAVEDETPDDEIPF